MENICDWCNEETSKVETHQSMGVEYHLCKKCLQAAENDVCVECGKPLYGEMSVKGQCSVCQQIQAAKVEKRRSETLNGLGLDALAELTHSVAFTEEDYNRWVTFGQGNFSPDIERRNKRNWIRRKLMHDNEWPEEVFNDNAEDIMWILDNYSHSVFKETCKFIVIGIDKVKMSGLNIVVRRGNVVVIDSEV